MRFLRPFAVLLAVWVSACCCRLAEAPAVATAHVVISQVDVIESLPVAQGVCRSARPGKPREIVIVNGLSPGREAVVIAHELGHALGLGHSENPGSVMWWTGAALGEVCPVDVEQARLAPFPMTVRATLRARGPLLVAVAYWNRALGRTQFVVAR